MYDQYGFYSESGFPGAGAGGPGGQGPHPGMDFSGFDFSDTFQGAGRRSAGGAPVGGRRDRAAAASATSFRSSSAGAGRSRAPEPEKGGDLEYVMDIDFWQAIKGTQARLNITRYEICDTCHGSGVDRRPGEVDLPAMQRHRQRHPDGRRHEVQSDLPALRRLRASCATPAPPAAARAASPRTETVEVRIPPGARNGSRLRVPGKGNAGTMGAPPGRPVHHHQGGGAPLLPSRGRQHRNQRPGGRLGSGARAPRSKCPPSTAATLLKIPQGTQQRPAFPPARERRSQLAHQPARRSDRGSGHRSARAARRADPRTAARAGQAAPGRSAGRDVVQDLRSRQPWQKPNPKRPT